LSHFGVKLQIMVNAQGPEFSRHTKILIAEDERDLAEMLAYNLEKKGFLTSRAYNGLEAWSRVEIDEPDLLILDLMMPKMDGWELCRLIRQHPREKIREIGILMLTARTLPEDRVLGLELGADDYLTKPFSLAELTLRVEKMVRKRKIVVGLAEEVERIRLEMKSREDNLRKVAHDLKTPLISMGASAKLLLRKDPDGDRSSSLTTIYENSLRLAQWVEDILRFQNPVSQDSGLEMKDIDIQKLTRRVLELHTDMAKEKQIEIAFRPSLDLLSVKGNETLLERALANLISNGLKYTPRGGSVRVSVTSYLGKEKNGVIEVSVEDTGIGIHGEDMERIFTPHCRGRNVSDEEGLGLGLSLTKEVVESHGGRILVHSEPNKGSIFSVLLPTQGHFVSAQDEKPR
jgi:signal transduction histidine kinase